MRVRNIILGVSLLAAIGIGAGCSSDQTPKANKDAQALVKAKQDHATIYVPKGNPELDNYNLRTKMADNPANIIWCTFFPPQNGQNPITVPIAGKLTSSGKRPFPDYHNDWSDQGIASIPNPDVYGMYGSSSEYRFGFDPTRSIYYDFTDLPSFCTNQPTEFQANSTTVVVKTDTTLNSLNAQAEAALKSGDAKGALKLLEQADSSGGK